LKKENIVFIVIALIIGLLGGYLIFSIGGGHKEAPSATGGMPVGAGSADDYRQRIAAAEKIVAADPTNRQIWIQLGNDYFDTGQAQKAINAYGKALELNPKDPNVLTDQGVMYQQVKRYDLAIGNFEKAQQIDPAHLQSQYNMGMVYAHDLHQTDKAIKALNRYLQLDSTSPKAQQVKVMIEQLKSQPKGFK
jgi:tetratricopeptide (TPR) repeat protein